MEKEEGVEDKGIEETNKGEDDEVDVEVLEEEEPEINKSLSSITCVLYLIQFILSV
jgi:hypothetical protein